MSGESKDEELDTKIEFTRQRQILEQSIVNLKKRIKTCIEKNDSYNKIMEENMVLMKKINKLRQEIKIKYKSRENLKSRKVKTLILN